jgi:hypothetical protein
MLTDSCFSDSKGANSPDPPSGLTQDELLEIPCRRNVMSPKRLRPFFLHDRKLLGALALIAYRTLRDFHIRHLPPARCRSRCPGLRRRVSVLTCSDAMLWLGATSALLVLPAMAFSTFGCA